MRRHHQGGKFEHMAQRAVAQVHLYPSHHSTGRYRHPPVLILGASRPYGYPGHLPLHEGFFALLGSVNGSSTIWRLLDNKEHVSYETVEEIHKILWALMTYSYPICSEKETLCVAQSPSQHIETHVWILKRKERRREENRANEAQDEAENVEENREKLGTDFFAWSPRSKGSYVIWIQTSPAKPRIRRYQEIANIEVIRDEAVVSDARWRIHPAALWF